MNTNRYSIPGIKYPIKIRKFKVIRPSKIFPKPHIIRTLNGIEMQIFRHVHIQITV